MITNILSDNIETFVKRLGAVNETQIMRMFNKHRDTSVKFCLDALVSSNRLRYDEKLKLYMRRQSINPNDFGQQLLTSAVWLLASMGEAGVMDFFPLEYPFQLFIIGENNTCYDITVFTFNTVQSLRMAVIPKRQTLIPNEQEDEIVHVAVIPDKQMASEIKDLGFDSFCILDKDNNPHYHQWK